LLFEIFVVSLRSKKLNMDSNKKESYERIIEIIERLQYKLDKIDFMFDKILETIGEIKEEIKKK